MESGARTRLVSTVVLILVLGTGFVLGLAWDRRSGGPVAEGPATEEVRERDDDRDRDEDEDDDRRDRRLIVDRIDLTPAQEARVDSIVTAHRERRERLRREIRSEYDLRSDALVQRVRDEIRTVLTLEQRERYDTLLARHDRREAAEERREERDDDRDDDRDRQ